MNAFLKKKRKKFLNLFFEIFDIFFLIERVLFRFEIQLIFIT